MGKTRRLIFGTGQEPVGRRRSPRGYRVYGLCLRSQWPLPCPEGRESDLQELELFDGSPALFSKVPRDATRRSDGKNWFQHLQLPDGSDYLRWSGLFEFLVSADGRRIACRELDSASPESFQTYLLGQVLSFALLKQGIEPLHATTVVIDGQAVAFLGDCGYGKSSLGAAFLQVGYALLTDDQLVLKEEEEQFIAYPGLPRIKLFPHIARSLLGERVNGTPMNSETSKMVIPLDQNGKMYRREPLSLRTIYVLTPPARCSRIPSISIRSLSPRRAFIEVLKGTFNVIVVEPARLERQFDLATRLAATIPVKSLSYPRDLSRLPAVIEAVESDLAR